MNKQKERFGFIDRDVQARIGVGRYKPNGLKGGGESLLPAAGALFETIERFVKFKYGFGGAFSPRGAWMYRSSSGVPFKKAHRTSIWWTLN